MSKSQRAQDLADEWLYWLHTRRFFAPGERKHILALLSMPDTSGEPPNARMSAEMAAFHLGVLSLQDHIGRAFIKVYCRFPSDPVKVLAYQENIGRDAYYARAHAGAEQVLAVMGRKLAMIENLGLRKVSSEYADDDVVEKQTKQYTTLSRVSVSL